MFCTTCGVCEETGVHDHCYEAGTAHVGFDDHPTETTGALLDILKHNRINATFFLIGKLITSDTAPLIKRMIAEGHTIASHTFNHISLNSLSNADVQSELSQTTAALEQASGVSPLPTPRYFRPPYGDINARVLSMVRAAGYTVVGWNSDTFDYYFEPMWTFGNISTYVHSYSLKSHSLLGLAHARDNVGLSTVQTVMDMISGAGYRWVDLKRCLDKSRLFPNATNATLGECWHPPSSSQAGGVCGHTLECAMTAPNVTCCSQFGFCGTGPDYCGSGCINGPCDSCVAAGFVPKLPPLPPPPPPPCTGLCAAPSLRLLSNSAAVMITAITLLITMLLLLSA